jgi:SOS response regulatory protein OraA/RecX
LRTLRSLDAATARRRLYAFLARRGYDASDIRRYMDSMPGEALPLE